MQYIVSISGGVSSAVAADRAVQRYGPNKVTLWFADTLWEDEDLYRFLADLLYKRFKGVRFIRHIEGRNPLQVAEDRKIMPNNMVAPCTFELKIKPFEKFLWSISKSVTVLLGMGWQDQARIDKRQRYHKLRGKPRSPRGYHARIPGVYEDFPLLWAPIITDPFSIVRSWNIKIPRLYQLGFSHNNCGGRCFRQGIRSYQILRKQLPDRYAELRDWEQRPREGAQATRTILKETRKGIARPLSLAELEKRACTSPSLNIFEDRSSCLCSY